jgi:DNA-binding response OmpR family regulator/DNA-binding CsgD family transcriptional regulator
MELYSILMVDDDPEHLKMLTGHLIAHKPDFQLLIATNGKAGYEIAVKKLPDLILMDWEMPQMTGLEAIRMIKAHPETRAIPIIMITGTQYDTEKLKEAMAAGAIDFVNKPYNAVELIARIMTQINHVEITRKLFEQQEQIKNQEKELLSREKTILEQEIYNQKKHLTLNSANMVQQGDLLQSLISELKKVFPYTSPEGKSILNSLIMQLNDKSNERLWNEFELSFEKVHSTFYMNLINSIPDISVREKRLCAFLRMNMTTKEIAAISFQTMNAIDVAKHRLRKKTGTENDEEFMRFLMSL